MLLILAEEAKYINCPIFSDFYGRRLKSVDHISRHHIYLTFLNHPLMLSLLLKPSNTQTATSSAVGNTLTRCECLFSQTGYYNKGYRNVIYLNTRSVAYFLHDLAGKVITASITAQANSRKGKQY